MASSPPTTTHRTDDDETAPLIPPSSAPSSPHAMSWKLILKLPAAKLIPSAFLAALAIATTAATEVYAYAVLSCKDPTHCDDQEQRRYAGTVSVAVMIANVCALLALRPFVRLGRRSSRAMLLCWLSLRSMSIVMLAFGVSIQSIVVAMSGRVFEGLASDNLLHLSLNAVYVKEDASATSRLVGLSLAMYMLGICIGPTLASLLPSFQTSFAVALLAFAVNFLYVLFIGGSGQARDASATTTSVEEPQTSREDGARDQPRALVSIASASSPLSILKDNVLLIVPSVSLLCYNLVQSFVFTAMMLFTTLRFSFTGRQNGFIISIVHAVAAIYLLTSLVAIPWLLRAFKSDTTKKGSTATRRKGDRGSAIIAAASMMIEALSLLGFSLARESWQVYPLAALTAIGLSAPSFIKSYAATLVPHDRAPEAMAVLTVFETTGSLLAPLIIGGLLTGQPGPMAFLASAGLMFSPGLFLLIAVIIHGKRDWSL